MRHMHRVRIYPTQKQAARLVHILHVTRHLYNAALQERRDAYRDRGITVTAKMVYGELTALRAEDPVYRGVYRECLDGSLHRLELGMQSFFRRIARGEKAGYPRFKPDHRWNSIEFPHGNRALKYNADQTKVRIPSIGSVRVRKGREVPLFGRAVLFRKNGRWWAIIESEREPVALPKTGKTVSIDRGVHVLAALSDGRLLANLKSQERERRVVTGHQRALDALTVKDAKGRCLNRKDPKRVVAVRKLARAKEHEANCRLDYAHKIAHQLVHEYDVIGLEKLNLRAMTRSANGTIEKPGRNVKAKSGLNRVVLDAGFGMFRRLIGEKAAYAVRRVIDVDARYSSQTCGRCLHVDSKSRRRRRFCCVACGWTCHADVAAALEIQRRAQLALSSGLWSSCPRLTLQDAA